MNITPNSLLEKEPINRLADLEETQIVEVPLIAGRYEVVNTYAGGMGVVHLCRDHSDKQLVALKTFKPEYLSHHRARDLFLREGTMWVELGRHPHIVRAYRVERVGDGSEVYLVLNWIVQPEDKENPSLRAWLKRGQPLPIKQALLFALHITRGMQFAVGKIPGLVHRDLKPENVLVGYDGHARVTDFGLASTLSGMEGGLVSLPNRQDQFARTQLTQGVAGTPLYMAPEQWAHQKLDERADIYALGCILYEMVSGYFAAQGETREALRKIHMHGRIKSPPSSVPRSVVMFLHKCMRRNREERYLNWHEVEKAISSLYWRLFGEHPPAEPVEGDQNTPEERLAAGNSYNMMGLSYLDIGKLPVAVMYFEQAVWIARAQHSLELESKALGNLGLAYTALGYIKRAVEFHEEHLIIARKIGDRAEEGRALGNLGSANRRLGNPDLASGYHERELFIAQELQDRYKEAAALYSLGDTYRQLNDRKEAVTYYKQSLVIAKEMGDRPRVRSVLSSMGHIYLDDGEVKEAAALFHQALEMSREIADRVGEGKAWADLGHLYRVLGYDDHAIEFYNYALNTSHKSNDLNQQIHNLVNLGDLHFQNLDKVKQAKEYYEKALAIAQEVGDQVQEMALYDRLGLTCSAMGDYMEAASLHRRARTLAKKIGDRHHERDILHHLGRAYEEWGDTSRALKYFSQHRTLSQAMGDPLNEIHILQEVGRIYHRKLKQLRNAKESYLDILALARTHEQYVIEVETLIRLGDLYRESGDAKQASDYYKEATAIGRDRNDAGLEALGTSNLALAQHHQGWKWQAARLGDKATKLVKQTSAPQHQAQIYYKLALLAKYQGKANKVKTFAEEAHQLFDELGDNSMIASSQRLLDEVA